MRADGVKARSASMRKPEYRQQNQSSHLLSPLQTAVKPTKVKDEPLGLSGVKGEPGTGPANKQSSRASKEGAQKGGAEEKKKRVIVKKEYDMPGQTKDTPIPVSATSGHLLSAQKYARRATHLCTKIITSMSSV